MIIVRGEGIKSTHIKARIETVMDMKDRQIRQKYKDSWYS